MKYFTAHQVAKQKMIIGGYSGGLTYIPLMRKIKAGLIEAHKTPGGFYLISEEEIQKFNENTLCQTNCPSTLESTKN